MGQVQGLSLTELDLGNDLQVVLGWRGQSEVAVLVENDQLMADSETVRFGESSLAPEEFAGLDVRGRDQRGAEVAAGAVDDVAVAHSGAVHELHLGIIPKLLCSCRITLTFQLDASGAHAVGGGDEKAYCPDPKQES